MKKLQAKRSDIILIYSQGPQESAITETSRDRPKSAPYPRLKNSKRTSKSQLTVLQNRKSKKNGRSGARGPASSSPWRAKRGTLPKLSLFLSQLKERPFGEKNTNFPKKNLTLPKKTERGALWDFPTSILDAKQQKIEGGTLWSSRPVWYVTRKNRKTFLVQFARQNGAIWCNNIL